MLSLPAALTFRVSESWADNRETEPTKDPKRKRCWRQKPPEVSEKEEGIQVEVEVVDDALDEDNWDASTNQELQ